MLQLFIAAPGSENCRSLRAVIASGEALPYDLQERFFARLSHCELHNLYGPTEAAVDVTAWACRRSDPLRIVPIGRPIANLSIYLLDQRGEPVPQGVPGELFIGGVGVGRGYHNRPELTTERFLRDPFAIIPDHRMYRTGDLARWIDGGVIEYLGRIDHQVKIRGLRIELGEIESLLATHHGVREAVVVPHGAGDHRHLVAYLVIVSNVDQTLANMRNFLRERLPEYMVPTAFIHLDALPLTPNGKVDRKALPAPKAATSAKVTTTEESVPHLAIYFQLLQLFEDLLNVRGVRLHDDFFALGGNSLLAFRLIVGIEQMTGRRLDLTTLFKNPTPNRLAKEILRGGSTDRRILIPVQPGSNTTPPFFFLHGDFLGGGYYCVGLARRLGSQVPFYTLAPRWLAPQESPPSIPELAAELVQEILAVRPVGPYHIGGFCIGGMIAHEVTRQLEELGHTVLQLTLVDAQSSYRIERLNRALTCGWGTVAMMANERRFSLFGRLNQQYERLGEVLALPFAQRYRYLLTKLGLNAGDAVPVGSQSSRLHTIVAQPGSEAQISLYQWSVCVHRPRMIAAPIHLFVSEELAALNREPTIGWNRFSRKVVPYQLPGLHLETITRHLPQLVKLLLPIVLHEQHSEPLIPLESVAS